MYTYKNLKISGDTTITLLICKNEDEATAYRAVIAVPKALSCAEAERILDDVETFEKTIGCELLEIHIIATAYDAAAYAILMLDERVKAEYPEEATVHDNSNFAFCVDGYIYPVKCASKIPVSEDFLQADAKSLFPWDPQACVIKELKGRVITDVDSAAVAAYNRYKMTQIKNKKEPKFKFSMTADMKGNRLYLKLF